MYTIKRILISKRILFWIKYFFMDEDVLLVSKDCSKNHMAYFNWIWKFELLNGSVPFLGLLSYGSRQETKLLFTNIQNGIFLEISMSYSRFKYNMEMDNLVSIGYLLKVGILFIIQAIFEWLLLDSHIFEWLLLDFLIQYFFI